MKISIQLTFNGNCREAFEFYAAVFGGKIVYIKSFSEAPSPLPEDCTTDSPDHIMHATLEIDGYSLLGCDVPQKNYDRPAGFSIAIHTNNADEARRIFAELADGGNPIAPIAETFWSPAFGMVTDRFGTPWLINSLPV